MDRICQYSVYLHTCKLQNVISLLRISNIVRLILFIFFLFQMYFFLFRVKDLHIVQFSCHPHKHCDHGYWKVLKNPFCRHQYHKSGEESQNQPNIAGKKLKHFKAHRSTNIQVIFYVIFGFLKYSNLLPEHVDIFSISWVFSCHNHHL